MFKKVLFTMLTIISVVAYSEVTQSGIPQGNDPVLVNDIEPVFEDVTIKDKSILPGNPWGTILLSSAPVVGGVENSVSGVKLSLKVICKNDPSGRVKSLSFPNNVFCSYQKAEFDKKAFSENQNINSWIYQPELNISQDGKAISVLIKTKGSDGSCGPKTIISVPVRCP